MNINCNIHGIVLNIRIDYIVKINNLDFQYKPGKTAKKELAFEWIEMSIVNCK